MVTPQRQVLVDGHNVLHAWGWIGAGEPVARARLIEALHVLHDVESVAVTVVFDSPNTAVAKDAAETSGGVVVKYATAGLSADGEIERLAAGDVSPQHVLVFTGDTQIRGNVQAAGGEVQSPQELRGWLDRCQARTRRALRARKTEHRGKFENKLPL